jgi:hypothetical protein
MNNTGMTWPLQKICKNSAPTRAHAQHTSADVSIRQHTSSYDLASASSARNGPLAFLLLPKPPTPSESVCVFVPAVFFPQLSHKLKATAELSCCCGFLVTVGIQLIAQPIALSSKNKKALKWRHDGVT